ncbi:hypothetical protein [Burkholderia pseudomallei]|uniref:hypothetical protein n=1 Tax=Burkholderia pseudomallei TaxID=28450 RepID=UPI000F1DEE14|nr:hypothetical protein [Burkholderia pseudomallei]CAJ2933517.1 Uncharacterised protein [Burkholderia pseudomallei]VBW57721.1 Uncharacterised protein [Burkholderia pseudomallei]VBW77696.1 Uncharacterised protein [Burkholderia pseudomallei]VBW79680.1 Uncharacterised protein [Burkholderia pseudomallei]VBW79987.1 Uncharacterised protein [Burkholderia pseudomallei]
MTEQQQPEHPAAQDVPLTEQEAGGSTRNPTSASGQDHAPVLGMQSDAGAETASASGNDPNAAASPAVASSASGTLSSVNLASQPGVTLAASAFVAERIRASVQRIREHLWTFERSAVEHLHAELDVIERLL